MKNILSKSITSKKSAIVIDVILMLASIVIVVESAIDLKNVVKAPKKAN